MADPDEALIEAIAEELTGWQIGTGYYSLNVSSSDAREMAQRVVEHLGLVEETLDGSPAQFDTPHHCDAHPIRRLVSEWTEVDHGSE